MVDFVKEIPYQDSLYNSNCIIRWNKTWFNGIIYSPNRFIIDDRMLLEHFKQRFEQMGLCTLDNKPNPKFSAPQFLDLGKDLLYELYRELLPKWIVLITRHISNGSETSFVHYKIDQNLGQNLNINSFNIDSKISDCYKLILK